LLDLSRGEKKKALGTQSLTKSEKRRLTKRTQAEERNRSNVEKKEKEVSQVT